MVLLVGFAVSVVGTAAAFAFVVVVLIRLPADYFCVERPRVVLADRHPMIRRMAEIVKYLLGGALIALGLILAMPGVPGPGIVTALTGVIVIDFPQMRLVNGWLHPSFGSAWDQPASP